MSMSNIKDIEQMGKSSLSKKVVFSLLKKLTDGHIRLIENGQEISFGNSDANIKATVTVHDQKAYSRILWGGSIGALLLVTTSWVFVRPGRKP